MYNKTKLLKIILFSFMENGYLSLRELEKLCKINVRYMWLLDDTKAPTFIAIGNFIKNNLIDKKFAKINKSIFEKKNFKI